MPGPLHLVVGIDFGYTHTGVAFQALESGELTEPCVVNQWPGKEQEVVNKVATRISYRAGQSGLDAWGFKVPRKSKKRIVVEEYFKLFLDKNLLKSKSAADSGVESDGDDSDDYSEDEDADVAGPQFNEVQKWFVDFLGALYNHVQVVLAEKYDRFGESDTKVDYLFSVPTTWPPNVVAEFQRLFHQAGFGSVEGHTANAGLTEAEAAAVYTAVYDAEGRNNPSANMLHKYQKGDILLVCDAGGGTTDVSVLKVVSINPKNNIPQLNQLSPVQGDAIGSVQIDEAFQELVKKRFRSVNIIKKVDRARIAREMTGGDFQHVKVHFGESSVRLVGTVRIKVPSLSPKYNNPKARIRQGEMEFTLKEIEELFNDRIEGIIKLIDNQMQFLTDSSEHADAKVKYLVLSGGLGSSEYLRQCLEEHYIQKKAFANAENTTILVANEPQLVVCRGLVLQRVQQSFKISIISGRCCRASYGIIHDVPWDKTIHKKSERHKNYDDGKYYVQRIHWLVSKNEFVKDDDPPKQTFKRSINYHQRDKWISHRIVKHGGLRKRPDTPLQSSSLTRACSVECNLGPAIAAQVQGNELEHVEVGRKTFLGTKLGGRFYRVEYDIYVHVGPADLRFSLWFDGKMRSGQGEVKVDWDQQYKMVADRTDSSSESEDASDDEEEEDDQICVS